MGTNQSPAKRSQKAALLMMAGSIVLICSWAISLPARFRSSSLQAQSESLEEDINQLRSEIENISNEPTAAEASRLKSKSEEIEKRFQKLKATAGSKDRFEWLELLGMALGCVLIISGVVLRVFGSNPTTASLAGSDSEDASVSEDAAN